MIERNFPGASELPPGELSALSRNFFDALAKVAKPHSWIESFVTKDKIYCIHVAENEEQVREHARIACIPISAISEVTAVIDPLTGYPE